MLTLKKANTADSFREWQFVRQIPPDENGFTNPWYGVSHEDFVSLALPQMLDYEKGRNLPDGYVPETFLFLWSDNEIIGQFRIRHFLNEDLCEGAGHIGYFVRKEFRGKGFGREGLRMTLDVARRIVPEDEIYLRVNRNNPASLRIMLHNGGVIHHEDGQKYYVRIPK